MKGARRFLTYTRIDLSQADMSRFVKTAVPIASITSIEPYEVETPYASWNTVRAKVNLIKGEFHYVQETMEELVAMIETPAVEETK